MQFLSYYTNFGFSYFRYFGKITSYFVTGQLASSRRIFSYMIRIIYYS